MKQSVKNKLLAATAEDVVRKVILICGIICTFLAGTFVGYSFADEEYEPCQVGFASLEDMMFLVSELRECEGFSRYDL